MVGVVVGPMMVKVTRAKPLSLTEREGDLHGSSQHGTFYAEGWCKAVCHSSRPVLVASVPTASCSSPGPRATALSLVCSRALGRGPSAVEAPLPLMPSLTPPHAPPHAPP